MREGESETFPKDVEGDVTSDKHLINLTPLSCVPQLPYWQRQKEERAEGGGSMRICSVLFFFKLFFCCYFLCPAGEVTTGNVWRETGGSSALLGVFVQVPQNIDLDLWKNTLESTKLAVSRKNDSFRLPDKIAFLTQPYWNLMFCCFCYLNCYKSVKDFQRIECYFEWNLEMCFLVGYILIDVALDTLKGQWVGGSELWADGRDRSSRKPIFGGTKLVCGVSRSKKSPVSAHVLQQELLYVPIIWIHTLHYTTRLVNKMARSEDSEH